MMENPIGQKKWHRVLGWVTVLDVLDYHVCVESQYKHIRHFITLKGWIDYTNSGRPLVMHLQSDKKGDELFDQPQNDFTQELIKNVVQWIE